MARLAVILYAERHQPRGGYAAMFRCVARLRAQQPEIAWYGAFGDEHPRISMAVHDAHRYGATHPLIIPWTLGRAPTLDPTLVQGVTVTHTIGAHPILREIVIQRANEAHYLRSPANYHTHTASTLFVGDDDTVPIDIDYLRLDEIITRLATHTGEVILQPFALSQNAPLVHELIQQTARGMPLERFGVGRAIEYDRRLLTMISDIVRQYR